MIFAILVFLVGAALGVYFRDDILGFISKLTSSKEEETGEYSSMSAVDEDNIEDNIEEDPKEKH